MVGLCGALVGGCGSSGGSDPSTPAPVNGIDDVQIQGGSVSGLPACTSAIGCFVDKPNRDLSGTLVEDATMTTPRCLRTCREGGFKYASRQDGHQCFCGNSYGKYGRARDAECDKPCRGNSRETCGGFWRNWCTKSAADASAPLVGTNGFGCGARATVARRRRVSARQIGPPFHPERTVTLRRRAYSKRGYVNR
jgi:hypothetical protein